MSASSLWLSANDQKSSAGKWMDSARTTVAEVTAQGRFPLLVGGTGLYIRALSGRYG